MIFYSKWPRGNGHQPTIRPETLEPPRRGPAYVPKREVTIYIKEVKNE